ncbi:MAG: response regulator transcription factor [bacterium]|nr:response regulator transcription factor [bacterium]
MADTPTRVMIVDDQEVVREGLRAILGTVPSIEVVGVVGNGAEAVESVATLFPEVVLMDLNMPIMNGVEATRNLQATHPDVKVLILTTYDAEEWVLDAIRAGASGYMLKDAPRERLIEAIQGTAEGRSHIDPSVAGGLMARVAVSEVSEPTSVAADLSERELDVLRLLGNGMTNSAIAEQLFLSEGTVRNYVSAILTKLQVEDRTQAAVLAVRHGLA